MFLAIINDTYTEVKEELSSQKNELQITDIIKQVKIRLTPEFSERYTHTHTHSFAVVHRATWRPLQSLNLKRRKYQTFRKCWGLDLETSNSRTFDKLWKSERIESLQNCRFQHQPWPLLPWLVLQDGTRWSWNFRSLLQVWSWQEPNPMDEKRTEGKESACMSVGEDLHETADEFQLCLYDVYCFLCAGCFKCWNQQSWRQFWEQFSSQWQRTEEQLESDVCGSGAVSQVGKVLRVIVCSPVSLRGHMTLKRCF